MKLTAKLILLIGVFGLVLSCKKESTPEPSLEDQQLTKLSQTWKATSVVLDGVDQTGYGSFTLTLSGTPGGSPYAYTTSGRPALSPWPSSGNWVFGTDIASEITRDKGTADELSMTYTVSETTLQLTFTYNGNGYSRVDNVKGQWTMTFGL